MIGQLQWLITIGRMSAVTTMARFRMEPREGHLKRLKRMYGYLRNKRFRDGAIRYRTGHIEHDLERDVVYDWQRTVYGDVHEVIPRDAPNVSSHRELELVFSHVRDRSVRRPSDDDVTMCSRTYPKRPEVVDRLQ